MEAVGPVFAAGFQSITSQRYVIIYLPDLHNDELQRMGKAPVYWWLPNEVRLARKDGDKGDYKFHFTHFEGIRGTESNIGVSEDNEVTGGLVAFSTTSAPPTAVLEESQNELLKIMAGKDDRFWGWRTKVAPQFRPAPIVSNVMTLTNLSPAADGTVPTVASAPAAPAPGTPAAPTGGPAAPAVTGPRSFRAAPVLRNAPPPAEIVIPRSVRLRDVQRASNLDMWYANLQGQGSGSVSPLAENAYSGLVGSIPAALIWSSFHAGTGGISVWQKLKMKVWSPIIRLVVEGDWDRIQDHFSAAFKASGWFWSFQAEAQFNSMRQNGDIKVTIEVDTTLPNSEKIQEELSKRSNLVFDEFMKCAQKTIFEPAPYQEKPAEASGGGFFGGGGAAFKMRRDQTHLNLRYDETKQYAYLQDYPISGQLTGLYDEIQADKANEKKYFTTLYLSEWERKVHRVIKPVANFPDPAQKWVGEPVAFLSAQVGYPTTGGAIEWTAHVFQRTDAPDAHWETDFEMKRKEDVPNPPNDWTPDKTFLKRTIHFTEPPSEFENPFVRMSVEKNTVELDPGEFGSLMNDINQEVRVDNVGMMNVGPISLGVELENSKQFVEVTFQALGKTDDGKERPEVKFSWQYEDQNQPRLWMIYTGQKDFVPQYRYKVRVVVKGSLFTKGMEWEGDWVTASGNGALIVTVPTQEEAVKVRVLPASVGAVAGAVSPGPPRPALAVGPPRAAVASAAKKEPEKAEVAGYAIGAAASGKSK